MRIAYVDCFSGAAGDMLVGACLDAGVSLAELQEQLRGLQLGGYKLRAERVRRQTIAGTLFSVDVATADGSAGHGHEHRHLPEIERMIAGAGFRSDLEQRMLATFRCLAEAEAKAHDESVDRVHFHEVGAVDAIVDICSAVLAFEALGVERVYASEIVVGTGLVDCAHGTMPVPAPGTLALLEGLPVRAGSLRGERCTPTGAALLRTLVDEFATSVSFRPERIGYGAGRRDDAPVPNLVRVTVGSIDDPGAADTVWELSLQVDNVSGETLGHALRQTLTAGALDAWATPTVTKKNRPAHWVVALADDAAREAVELCLLTQLPTLGLRRNRVHRRVLPRRVEERQTPLGVVRYKVRTLPDGTEVAHPEADDVERIASETGLPLPVVLARIGG